MLSDCSRVATVSIHANSNFPPRKRCSDLDVFLPNMIDDVGYATAAAAGLDEDKKSNRCKC